MTDWDLHSDCEACGMYFWCEEDDCSRCSRQLPCEGCECCEVCCCCAGLENMKENRMKFYEVMRDDGCGEAIIYRFATKEEADQAYKYFEHNGELIDYSVHAVDTDDKDFFDTVKGILLADDAMDFFDEDDDEIDE